MFSSEVEIRVRYGETDRMGYVYYGNYAQYFEVARVEALRKLGMSYKELEDGGILLPVYNFSIKFIQPAYYDDLLTINTYIKKLPSASIHFDYETINSNGDVINQADTTLVFINKGTNKPQKAPSDFMEMLSPFFK